MKVQAKNGYTGGVQASRGLQETISKHSSIQISFPPSCEHRTLVGIMVTQLGY